MGDLLSHLAEDGSVKMVDVSGKPVSKRVASAEATITLQPETISRIWANHMAKGTVLATARSAAIQAVKRTDELTPLCHSLPVQHVEVDFQTGNDCIRVRCQVATSAQTGVEMEALTGASIAALTIYDMCKAIDKEMSISGLHLISKTKEPL